MRRATYLCASMIAVAALGYHWLRLARPAPGPARLARPLEHLPMTLGTWVGEDVQLSANVIRVAAADDHLRRDYEDPAGSRVSLYIAFYGNVKDRVPHGPTVCYPSQGWETKLSEMIALSTPVPRFAELRVRKLVYEREGSRVAVLYWYAANGKQQIASTWQKIDSALRELIGQGGAYVIQVMVTAPVTGHREAAFEPLERFLSRNFAAVAEHFPPEGKALEEDPAPGPTGATAVSLPAGR